MNKNISETDVCGLLRTYNRDCNGAASEEPQLLRGRKYACCVRVGIGLLASLWLYVCVHIIISDLIIPVLSRGHHCSMSLRNEARAEERKCRVQLRLLKDTKWRGA